MNPLEESEVRITYRRAKTGKDKTIPIWFTVNGGKMELLPMYGLKTKWLADVQKSGELKLNIEGWSKSAKPTVVKKNSVIEGIKGRFGAKYGASDVRRYYPDQDVALEIVL